jgi:hypothetical protein
VLPGLSDDPAGLANVVRAARAAGARSIWCAPVHLRPGAREHFLAALSRDWPEEVDRYEHLFADRSYLPASLGNEICARVRALAAVQPAARGGLLRPGPRPVQLTLAV